MKLLWLSRHEITEDQRSDLLKAVEGHAYLPDCEEVEIIHLNITFPAKSRDAVREIIALIEEHKPQLVSGVFPNHVVLRLSVELDDLQRYAHELVPLLVIPVSVPVQASEGQVRGFAHSHWEFS
jgi:hypothetical protein